MERLFSPWRLGYVTGASRSGVCIFCDAIGPSPELDRQHLVLVRGRVAFVMLNRYPYNNGHLMVAPNRHVASLAGLSTGELDEIMRFTRDSEVVLNESYQPEGINVGINLGRP